MSCFLKGFGFEALFVPAWEMMEMPLYWQEAPSFGEPDSPLPLGGRLAVIQAAKSLAEAEGSRDTRGRRQGRRKSVVTYFWGDAGCPQCSPRAPGLVEPLQKLKPCH